MVLLYMVLHGSHQYAPVMLAYIYIPAPWILWVISHQLVSIYTIHGSVMGFLIPWNWGHGHAFQTRSHGMNGAVMLFFDRLKMWCPYEIEDFSMNNDDLWENMIFHRQPIDRWFTSKHMMFFPEQNVKSTRRYTLHSLRTWSHGPLK